MLEAAHLVYYQFWSRNLDKVLQPVPNCGNFKYLTKQQIDSLSLRKHLCFNEDVLLVREEYKAAYTELKLCEDNHLVERTGGMVVTGQSGIGMHPMCYVPASRDLDKRDRKG
jgi:hypothetical protein